MHFCTPPSSPPPPSLPPLGRSAPVVKDTSQRVVSFPDPLAVLKGGGSRDETSHTGYSRCIKDHPTPYHGNKPHVCVHSNVPIGAVLQPAYRDSTACLMTSEGHRRKTDPLCTTPSSPSPPSSPPLGRPAPDASAVARRT